MTTRARRLFEWCIFQPSRSSSQDIPTYQRAALSIGTAAISTVSVSTGWERAAGTQVTRVVRGNCKRVVGIAHGRSSGRVVGKLGLYRRRYNEDESQKIFRREHDEVLLLVVSDESRKCENEIACKNARSV
jgi:hypothetical protein